MLLRKRKPEATSSRRSSRVRRASRSARNPSRKHAGANQADILMIADDAALAGKYDRATCILAEGKQRTIATAYKTTTPASALVFEFSDRGWSDAVSIDVTASDIAALHAQGSHAPVTDAIVKQVIRWLRYCLANRTSSDSYEPDVSYLTSFEVSNCYLGEEEAEELFLLNFTAREERLVFDAFVRWRRDIEDQAIARTPAA